MTSTIEQYLPFAKHMLGSNGQIFMVLVTHDNIDCNMEFKFHRCSKTIYCSIRTPKRDLFSNNFGTCNKIETIEQMADGIMQIFNQFKAMKFNRCIGTFEPIELVQLRNDIELAAGDLLRVMNECCVCLLKTKTATCCGHYLCDICHDNLNKNVCPICRNSLDAADDEMDE